MPEAILAEPMADADLVALVGVFLERRGRAIVSRLRPEQAVLLRATSPRPPTRSVGAAARPCSAAPALSRRGKVGLRTAGISDVSVAEGATVVAREMGCEVLSAHDVGVAGIRELAGAKS